MNYFYSNDKKSTIEKRIMEPFFSEFVAYMDTNKSNEIILRELKKEFPQKKFEQFLDQLIQEKLVTRENRRYTLHLPIFSNESMEDEIEETTQKILDQLLELTKEEQQLAMGEEIWRYCFEEDDDYFYAVTSETLPIDKQSAGNDSYQFVSLNYQTKLPVTLANYFYLQKQQLPIPKDFILLAQTIGDVNETYFFDQVEVIIERIKKQKYKKRRPSIFFDALVLSDTLKIEEEIQLPIISSREDKISLPSLGIKYTSAERAYIKRKVYESLVALLSLKDYSYILENRKTRNR